MRPDPDAAQQWSTDVATAHSLLEFGAQFVFSRTALARSYELGVAPTFASLRQVLDGRVIDPLSVSQLVDAIAARVAWVEDMPVAIEVVAWASNPAELRESAVPLHEAIPAVTLAISLLLDEAPRLFWGGPPGAAGLHDVRGTYVRAGDEGQLAPTTELRVIRSRREFHRHRDSDPRGDARLALLGEFAALCDEACFDDHSSRAAIHPAFATGSGMQSADPSVARTALRLSATAVHNGQRLGRRLRTSGSASSPGRISRRHGGEGRRVHVTKHGAAYRLHAWQAPDGRLELASLEPKAYTDIPD